MRSKENRKPDQRVHPPFLPANPALKEELTKWEQDFQNLNPIEVKFPKAPQATGKYYKMVDPCFEERMQELNRKFGNIYIPRRKSGIYWIQVRRAAAAAAAVEISLWTR